VHIKQVILENIRGFESLDFDFARPDGKCAGWTVITGDNAAGKTTLLKAISAALVGPAAIRSLQPSLRGWIRHGSDSAVIAVRLVADPKDGFARGRPPEQPFWSELRLAENGGPEVSLSVGRKYLKSGRGPKHGPWAENPTGWFSAGYGPFRRLYGASPEAQRIMVGASRLARFATMFREDATLGECEIWLKELHHRTLEGSKKEESLLEQVKSILNDDFLQHGICLDRVDSEGLWLRQPDDTVLRLADMSEGYRAALAMLVDILRHIADVYGTDGLVEDRDGRKVVPHSGVVLIDEVDSHLHPEWQRRLGFWFKEKLPYIQFIVTTHSPIICQAADEDGIFRLPAPGEDARPFRLSHEDYQRIIKDKPDAIYLSPAFKMEHTRSPRAVANRRKFAELRAKQDSVGLTEDEKAEMAPLLPWTDDLTNQDEDHA